MYKNIIKRFIDIFISLLVFPITLIILIPISLLIKMEDGGPIFYIGKRIGKNKVMFKMFKFRSMRINSPDIRMPDGSTYNSNDDRRVTKIGKFLRESSLDELPQILNVFIGDMSLVGPRPDVSSTEKYPEVFSSIFTVRPGITGYNQAYFRNENNRHEKMKNDKYYADNISFYLDVKILVKTILSIIKRDGLYRR